ncbi:hypothetical protein H6P81_014822 [Aristolochia fimbriata]|uniref:Phytochrome n=1 Tax=Aristolochia fimbriata TaxID=158543 RepID=A0AAV7E3R7_ARIFI|nr:hypothetical protein H6P81_014822 [Aristolochia fimbriata]
MSSKSNRASCSRSNSAQSRRSARVVAQTTLDAKLHSDFEESEKKFNYSSSMDANVLNSEANISSSAVSAYLRNMQRGQLIQPFGCLIAVEEESFFVLAYSENAPEMLELAPHAVPSIDQQEILTIGSDVRTLFRPSSATALQKAASYGDVSLLNPILVHCRSSGKPFYAILHRIDVGLVMDLEPVNIADAQVSASGALKSYKLAAKAISRLQSLPSGNIILLCDVLVREVRDLTGYDRVMAYKFHEDEHGEVIAECKRPDLEPYLGLHYPATDIPQASRFLFMKNKVRMIYDCSATPVSVIQDKGLAQPLCLGGSTLRAPHGCHSQYMANMGSIASLVMSVTINEDDDEKGSGQRGRKLWGLVVCHHCSPRFIPFPFRYACDFLMQVFGIQINKEVELAAQVREKHILRTQTLLCDMLLRDAPMGIVNKSPNVMDLVKCDGAALYYQNKFWLLGTTPTEAQIRDLAQWLLQYHNNTTGLSTDSLVEAGYPGAQDLGDAVCGMAAVKITSRDFLFWFRSHAGKEIKWGGAKHDPKEHDGDGKKLHPRSSFNAFLEVVKWRSTPWEDVEMDAIHSLQLILRGSLQKEIMNGLKIIENAPSDDDRKILRLDELHTVTNEMVRLIETAIVPIFAVDSTLSVNGWNTKVVELTGISVENAIGTQLVDLVEDDSAEVVKNMLLLALQGKEDQNVEIKLKTFNHQEKDGPIILVVNACCSRDMNENVIGVCFVAQDLTEQKMVMDKYTKIQGDYNAIITSPSALIPPIFIINEDGYCVEWNFAMQKISGLKREEALESVLVGEVFTLGKFGCQVKDQDTLTKLSIVLNEVMTGQASNKLLFGFYDRDGKYVETLLSLNERRDSNGEIIGVFCFLHVTSHDLQHALEVQKISEQAARKCLKELTYVRQEIRNPLHGVIFTRNLMDRPDLSREQKQLLRTSTLCQQQLEKVLNDMDLDSIEECFLEMNNVEFNLLETLEAVQIQAMTLSQERQVRLTRDMPAEASSIFLYGDHLRLQQVLADFLTTAIRFSPPLEGSVELKVFLTREQIGTKMHIIHLEFRVEHPSPGIPEALVQEMFHHSRSMSREGLCLYISQMLVRIMNGSVKYLREASKSSFIVLLEFPLAHWKDSDGFDHKEARLKKKSIRVL